MKSALISIVSATLFVAGVSAQSLTVNTPLNVVVCQPLLISWSGGTPPYFLSVHPGATPDDPALVDFGTQNGTSFTWTAVNYPVGTSLDITIRDTNGLISQSAPFTVQTGSSTGCLNSTATGSGAPAAATTPVASSATPLTTGTTPTASKPTSSGSSASSSPATTTTAKSSGAMPISVSYAVAGVLGAIVVAVLA